MLADGSQCHIEVLPDRARVIIVVKGELDLGNCHELRDAIAEVRLRGFESFVVDLREVTCLDSAALRLLWQEHVEAANNGHSFAIADAPGAARRLLELSGLREHFDHGDPTTLGLRRSKPRRADRGVLATFAGLMSHAPA